MKLSRRVSAKQVKQAFLAADRTRRHHSKRYFTATDKTEFEAKLKLAKKWVKKLSNAQLDKKITYAPRRNAYNNLQWRVSAVAIDEIAVWKGAGGLPLAWTKGSLAQTAAKVSAAMRRNPKILKQRARRAIPGITEISLRAVQRDAFLLPIILPAGTIPSCRRGVKMFKGDIDDGSMRSIALAVAGKKKIKAYIGH